MKLWNEAVFVRTLVIGAFIVGAIGSFAWMYFATAEQPLYLFVAMCCACMVGAVGVNELAKKKGIYEVQNGNSK